MVYRVRIMALAVLVSLGAQGCGRQEKESPPQEPTAKVRLSYMPSFTSDLAIFVAMEKGYFRDEGVEIELVQFKSATDSLNALISGRTDMTGMIGFPALFSAFEKDASAFKAFLGTAETEDHWASAILVPPDSPIRSIADLRGRIVGTSTTTTHLLNLKSILAGFMDTETEVTIRQVSTDLQLPALESRQFDALFTIEPRVTTAVQKGIGRVLEENPRFKHILQPFPVTANCVSTRFLSQNQRATAAVYRALARAARDIREDEAAARQFLPKYTPLDPSLAAECHLYYWWQPADVDYEAVQRLADLFRGQGLLKKKIDTEAMFVHFE